MNYTVLKKQMQERQTELIYKRDILRRRTEDTTSYEYAKLTGQIIGLYEAIIMVQDMEIEDLTNKEVEKDV